MLSIDEAIKKVETSNKGNKVLRAGETEDEWVFLLDNDEEAYAIVNKNTGELGSMWFWDFGYLVTNGKAKIIK